MNIGKIINKKRLDLGYTIEEASKLCNVSKPTMIKIIHSNTSENISDSSLNKVLEGLNISLENDKEEEEIDLDNFVLNETNYFSRPARQLYCGASQFKSFLKCEAEALAEINDEIDPVKTKSLLEGSYMDARVEGRDAFRRFREAHPEIYTARGELKTEFKKADLAYDRVSQDSLFMSYLEGDKQTIMTGEIAGVKFKIKTDVLNLGKGRIVDLKYVKDFNYVWNEDKKEKQHFIEYWGYDIQGAIYREVVRQNLGISLPFYIAGITKEENTDYNVFQIADKDLDEALKLVEAIAPHIQALKDGKEKPTHCGHCRYCRSIKELNSAILYTKYIDEII